MLRDMSAVRRNSDPVVTLGVPCVFLRTWSIVNEEPLFSIRQRADTSHADHGEPHSLFLDRSDMPLAIEARALLEDWFSAMCPEAQPSIRSRITSGDDEAFSSALWELLLFRLFTRQGYEVTCEPPLPNSGKRIDFLVRRDNDAFYVEATIARRSTAEQGADARRSRIYTAINERVHSPNFMLGIQIESAGDADLPNLRALTQQLQAWLDGLDPDTVTAEYLAHGDLADWTWTDRGWRIEFQAIPMKPSARTDEPRQILGSFMDETGGAIHDEVPLLNAFRGKRPNRYGDLDRPYVIAVCEYPYLMGEEDWHRKNALFGPSGVRFGDQIEPEWVRWAGGFWRTGSGSPLNTRVSAVLLASHLAPWSIDGLRLEWWQHPFAVRPIPTSAIPDGVAVHSVALTGATGDIVISEPASSPSTVL
jgi:hypothetical protein